MSYGTRLRLIGNQNTLPRYQERNRCQTEAGVRVKVGDIEHGGMRIEGSGLFGIGERCHNLIG